MPALVVHAAPQSDRQWCGRLQHIGDRRQRRVPALVGHVDQGAHRPADGRWERKRRQRGLNGDKSGGDEPGVAVGAVDGCCCEAAGGEVDGVTAHSSIDVESPARGELASVMVVVLGRVEVDVRDGHDVLEVGIPADREVHREFECVLGLPGETVA